MEYRIQGLWCRAYRGDRDPDCWTQDAWPQKRGLAGAPTGGRVTEKAQERGLWGDGGRNGVCQKPTSTYNSASGHGLEADVLVKGIARSAATRWIHAREREQTQIYPDGLWGLPGEEPTGRHAGQEDFCTRFRNEPS